MRTLKFALLLLAATSSFGFAAHRVRAAEHKTVAVTISEYAFHQDQVTVCTGETVEWKNLDDDPHTVTALDRSFDSKGLGQSDTFRHVFSAAGRFAYYCAAHPFMKGAVIVRKCG